MSVQTAADRKDGLLEIRACPLCGSSDARSHFDDPPYSLKRCGACSLVWVTPRFSAERLEMEVYGHAYWQSESPKTHGYADYRRDEPLYLKTFRRRLGLVQEHAPTPGRALDVGCAAGFFLSVLREAGWQVAGVELSPQIASHALARFGIEDLHVGTLDSAPFREQSFDLITLWDVVEHVPDPVALLRRARELLKPNGVLLLETQNVDSRFAKLLGRRWQHYKHQEHLYHFNPATVERLLTKAGLRMESWTPRYGGKYVSFAFISERAARLHPVLSVLLKPLNLFKNANLYVNLRDEMVVVARPAEPQ